MSYDNTVVITDQRFRKFDQFRTRFVWPLISGDRCLPGICDLGLVPQYRLTSANAGSYPAFGPVPILACG
jgi:hypothetical protein